MATVVLLAFSISACEEDGYNFPYEYVNFQINLNDPSYFNLNAVGNYVYVYGGVQGIIIYRKSLNEFTAFDRACPYDYELSNARVFVDESGVTVIDTVCGSQFSLMLDGQVLEGPSQMPLKQYSTSYNQGTNILYVSN